jgi:hypothetical protein
VFDVVDVTAPKPEFWTPGTVFEDRGEWFWRPNSCFLRENWRGPSRPRPRRLRAAMRRGGPAAKGVCHQQPGVFSAPPAVPPLRGAIFFYPDWRVTQNCLPVTACISKACPSRMTFGSGHAEATRESSRRLSLQKRASSFSVLSRISVGSTGLINTP